MTATTQAATGAAANRLTMHPHWIMLISRSTLCFFMLATILTWVSSHVGAIARALHIYRGQPLATLLAWLNEHGTGVSIGLLAAAGIASILALLTWSITYIEIDAGTLIERQASFSTNRIPLHAIQDIRTTQSPLGLILDYGTLIVDSGRTEERIGCVPNFTAFVEYLNQRVANCRAS